MKNKKIIGIVGMPGSGKGIIGLIAKELSIPVVIMGDVIREETVKRGLEPNLNNVGRIMLKICDEEGTTIVAKKCLLKILSYPEKVVIVEGIRSYDEVQEFKKIFPNFTLIAVHSAPKTRYERIFKRRRSDDPWQFNAFLKRERRELKVGIGSVIAMADIVVLNEDSLDMFKDKIRYMLKDEIL